MNATPAPEDQSGTPTDATAQDEVAQDVAAAQAAHAAALRSGNPARRAAAEEQTPPARVYRSFSEALSELSEITHLRNQYPELAGLSTGIAALDKHIKHLLQPGRLIVVGGGTGSGKSALVNQLAAYVGFQDQVLQVILENTDVDTAARTVANLGRIDLADIQTGFVANGIGVPKHFAEVTELASGLLIDTIDRASLEVQHLARVIYDWKLDRKVLNGVVIVDQLSHLTPTDPIWWKLIKEQGVETRIPPPPANGAREDQILQWQTKVLKTIAEEAGVLMILVHQLNDKAGEGKPGLDSMRGSRGINHEADLILMPHRPLVDPDQANNADSPPGRPIATTGPTFGGAGDPFGFGDDDGPGYTQAADPVAGMSGGVAAAKLRVADGEAFIICPKSRHGQEFEVTVRWVGKYQLYTDPESDIHAPTVAPRKPSAKALEGGRALAALSRKHDTKRKTRLAAAEAGLPLPLDDDVTQVGELTPEAAAAVAGVLAEAPAFEVIAGTVVVTPTSDDDDGRWASMAPTGSEPQ